MDSTSSPKIITKQGLNSAPLSFAQQRLWFLEQLNPGNPAYNIPIGIHLKGSLDVKALEQSLGEIVQRHQALRTTFTAVDGQPLQVIIPPLNWTLPIVDLRNLSLTERQQESQRLIIESVEHPFDLGTGPLLRATLQRLGENEYILLLTVHEIVCDHWSLKILLQELASLYEAFFNGLRSPLIELPIQYSDFAIWQRQWLQSEVSESHLGYWKQQLGGELPVLELPTDHPRPPVQTYRGARQFLNLPKYLTDALKELSQQSGVTLFTTLLTAFKTLLYRYTSIEDIIIGSPIPNRNQLETEGLIGLLANKLVIRTNLSGNPSFRELLSRVQEVVLSAYSHQDLPFEKLVEELQTEWDLSRSPLFQVMFVLQSDQASALEFPGLNLNIIEVESKSAEFDLTLELKETSEGINGWFEYNADLFDADTIVRMIGHWQVLLEGVVAQPNQQISYLPILTEAERHQLLVEWNDTAADYPLDKCIHQLFEEQVERTPDNVAVVFENQQLTYRELNAKANQLAHYLQKLGVGPEVLVGICVERSLLMVVGLLGILKAGGAYVPLDPKYPKERLAFMLEDAQGSVLLTQQTLFKGLPQHSAPVVYLDTDEFDTSSIDNPTSKAQSTNLAYVLYTSGSTGKPKGVAIEHGSTVALVSWATQTFTAEQLAGVLASTSFCFDISVFELFVPLSCGGKVILAENALHLSSLPAAEDVTLINTVPSAIAELVRAKGIPDGVHTVNLAGEALSQRVVELLYQQETIQEVYNLYGPSEDTIYSTYALVGRDSQKFPPIGRPIYNTQIYILDAYQQPVPVGVAGELHISGAGLARGYLNRPELTQKKFIPHLFCNESQTRLYKTGDLVRYLTNGNVEFLGRIDYQVKVRGNRIEVSEIESVLGQHSNVREVVVTAREDVPGDKRLFAYIVPNQEQANLVKELRSFLQNKLPDYMIPSAFVPLSKLPRTPNGKIDRCALPAPDKLRPELDENFVAPQTPIEKVLAGIWASLLGLDRVGIQDNFFELGGHSLLATQVISRVREAFSVELSLYSLFEVPTITSLAQRIEKACKEGLGLQALPILPRTQNENIPLSFAQQRLWFLDQLVPDAPIYNIPLAYRVTGQLNVVALEQSLGEIVRRHEALRTTFTAVDGQPIQVIQPQLDLKLAIIDLCLLSKTEQEAEVWQLITQEAQQPFDLTVSPLLRVKLLRVSEIEHLLLLTMHHIVSDGWSIGILMPELITLYEAFAKGKPSPLPELPIQYADFAIWQRQWLLGEVLDSQLSYWKQKLSGELPVLELPTDRPRSLVQTYQGAKQSFELSKDLTESLKVLSRESGVTLFMTLLAAFKTLLYRYTEQEDIIVGSPVANRNWAEIEGLIGFFVNTLVLRTDLSGAPSFRELLSRVREVALGAYAHQDIPFEKVVEELQPERDMSYNPLFQVMFVLQNTPNPDWKLTELPLTFSPLEIENKTARFELTIELQETSEGIKCRFEYNSELFINTTIKQIFEQFQSLLEQIVAEPNVSIKCYSLITSSSQLLLPDPSKALPETRYNPVTILFTQWVNIMPENPAIWQDSHSWNYKELGQAAYAIAQVLLTNGVKRGGVIAVSGSRSFGLIASMLGVLMSGGVLLTLDQNLPKSRQQLMLSEAKAQYLLCVGRLLEEAKKIDEYLDIIHIYIKANTGRIIDYDNKGQVVDLPEISPDDPAYIFFTSGTTGIPKGVLGTHKGLSHFLCWQQQTFNIKPQDRIAQLTSLSFDVVLRDIFLPLTSGAILCLPKEEDDLTLGSILCWIEQMRISVLHTVPALAQSWLTNMPSGVSLCNLRWVFFAGEPLPENLVHQWRTAFPEAGEIVNLYGPTETTLAKCYYLVPLDTNPGIQPIGFPLPETQVLILAENHQLCTIGEPGEIVLRTPFRSLGYINASQENQQRFVKNHFRNDKQDLLYYTGDRGRYRHDGSIEILGRLDNQIKIRGVRIELEEIEALLSQHPDIQATKVMPWKNRLTDDCLIAYIVPNISRSATIAEMRRYKLPNNLAIVHLNKNETDYLYKEIFELQAYLRHGITINDGDCILDVGANIGLFTLFIYQICQHPQIYSFEPNPKIFNILKYNSLLYNLDLQLLDYGLSDANKTEQFTFFQGFSILSGLYTDENTEQEVIKTYIQNQINPEDTEKGTLIEQADQILEGRFNKEVFNVTLRTISSVIEEYNIESIDLLKINVEKSELDVIRGIKDEDWKKIRQIVLEVDIDQNVEDITFLLKKYGYEFCIEQDILLKNTQLCYIYAIRSSGKGVLIKSQDATAHVRTLPILNEPILSSKDLHQFLKQKLPDYMIPSVFVMLEKMPLTTNGKVDYRALPLPNALRPELEENFLEPRTPIENILAGIWSEVLKLERISINDNFFELGGHSLLAVQIISRMRNAFSVDLPLRYIFEEPTINRLAEKIEAARQATKELLPGILPRTLNTNIPLSFDQQRLWFIAQLELDSSAYNVPLAYRIKGQLNIVALEQSINELVRRHEILRTIFTTIDEQPIQIVQPASTLLLEVVDLRHIVETKREIEAQKLIIEDAQQAFNFDQGILFRAKLLRLETEEHVFLLTMHHIVCDVWSISVLVKELTTLYEAFLTEKPSALSDLPIQYGDFAIWQRKLLHSKILDLQIKYWKKQLEGQLPVLELPTDRPRIPVQTKQGAREYLKLPKALSEKLKKLSQHEGITLFMLLLAAFKTLLYRYSGQEEIIVGSPTVNRNHSEIEGLIGFFVNTLVMRTYLGDNPSFRELLCRVREIALAAYANQDVPFEKLVEVLQPERDLSYNPLFQVMFTLVNTQTPVLALSNLTLTQIEIDNKTAKFDLFLLMEENEDGLKGSLEYSTDLFDPISISRMVSHFYVLLEALVAEPDLRLSDLPILTQTERHQLLVGSNPSEPIYPKNVCLHQLVEMQVGKTPKNVALVFENEQITYEELNCNANQLAHYLQNLGVQPGVTVAICMDLGVDLAVGILGILKAGGALLPLEPTYPRERLAFILEDAQTSIILTQQRLVKEIPQKITHIVCLDTNRKEIALQSQENLVTEIKSESLAYVLYTSGSTGKPKGVMLSHFVCCTRELWEQKTFQLTEADRVLLKSSWSSRELFWPLSVGARIIIPRPGGNRDSAYLVNLIAQQKITVISVVPSLFKVLLEEPNINRCTSLRYILCGGEALSIEVQQSFFNTHLTASLYNIYGLNEANYATIWKCQRHTEKQFVPIGRPTDMKIYLLDQHLQPVPIGVKGEIYIGGVGLSSGYFNRPDLTTKKFISNPFNKKETTQLYKTGDIGRYLSDGTIEYLGRIDHQVKIRGNRIELEEIEVVLRQHPAVEESVVLISRKDVLNDKHLVAYVVLNQQLSLTIRELRRYLKNKLPEYMIPSAFIFLDNLPLTFNGKINRLALPLPEWTNPEREKEFVAPATAVEQHVANVWSQVLKIERVGIHENFFALGGHSLIATQVISRLRRVFQIEIPLRYIYEAPTVAEQAERIEMLCWAAQNQNAFSTSTADDSFEDNFTIREDIDL